MRLAWGLLLAGILSPTSPAIGQDREKLTGVSADGSFYRLDETVVCRPLAASADKTASGWPECQRIAVKSQKKMRFEKPRSGKLRDGREVSLLLVDASLPEIAPPFPLGTTPRDLPSAKAPVRHRKTILLQAVKAGALPEDLVRWSSDEQTLAVEDAFVSTDGGTVVVVYARHDEARATVTQAVVAFRFDSPGEVR